MTSVTLGSRREITQVVALRFEIERILPSLFPFRSYTYMRGSGVRAINVVGLSRDHTRSEMKVFLICLE
jgi:hypothetical protein